jgi:hypothetical protein
MTSERQRLHNRAYDKNYRATHAKEIQARRREFEQEHPLTSRTPMLKSLYGIDIWMYLSVLKRQDAACAICHRHVKLVVDHCHRTGRFRGLLCCRCNQGIGMLADDQEVLATASAYLRGEVTC